MVMNTVETSKVISFIKVWHLGEWKRVYVSVNEFVCLYSIQKHALHGPEGKYPKEGLYTENLIKKAAIPFGSTYSDSKLCPFSYQS